MTELELKIKDAAQKYYTDGTSPLSDSEFDALVDKLRAENPDSELLKTGWGYSTESDTTGEKVKHKYGRAGSLSKVHFANELPKGFELRDASLKLDGLSVVLYYVDGQYKQALTRGDGEIGIDITSKLKSLVPNSLKLKFTGAIRGEIIMSFEKFKLFKEAHPEAKNPRNSAAGLINGKDMQADIEYYLEVVAYTVVGWENSSYGDWQEIIDSPDLRTILTRIYPGKIVPYVIVADEFPMDSFDRFMLKLKAKWYDKYPADGIVLTSSFTNTYPEVTWDSVAYKFPNESVEATVEEVEWNLSKTGYLVPKVRITPTEILGSTVSYCTGYNAQYIVNNKIGKGTVVTFSKRNEIVPNIDSIISNSTEYEFTYPTVCPVCGKQLVWEGVHLMCNNLECKNIQEQDILVWCDNIAPVDNLSDKIRLGFIERLRMEYGRATVDELMISANDKYKNSYIALKNCNPLNRGRIVLEAEFWNKLSNNDAISIESALKALNIPRLGDKTAKKFAEYPEMIQQLMNVPNINSSDAFVTNLHMVIGDANADSIMENSWKFKRLAHIAGRIQWIPDDEFELEGIVKVAITGKLSVKRAEFEKELKAAGYTPGEISKETAILITDDPNSNSSKNKKADAWDITKMTEAEFREKYLNN